MESKLVYLLAVVLAVALVSGEDDDHGFSAQYVTRHVGHVQPVVVKHGEGDSSDDKHKDKYEHIDYYAHPKFDYKYTIHDPHTGDYKSAHEDRDGDVVKGFYEFKEPDGSLRRVEYEADKHTGFHATVKHGTEHIVPKHEKHES